MPADDDVVEWLLSEPLETLVDRARQLRDAGHGQLVSYSRKVFVPLTRLCRDVCHYCTFATSPRQLQAPYLDPEQVLEIARQGQAAGCRELLFTLGDRPEARYGVARDWLRERGYASTIDYLAAVCDRVLTETSLLPHVNPGVMTREEIATLRAVSVSQGFMLESAAQRLCEPGGVHHGSPDKNPAVRLASLRLAGELQVPFTSGILIGIGETRRERLEALLALRQIHRDHGHLQEVIIQNFRAKPGTRCAEAAEPGLDDLAWTIAAARLLFGEQMNIQAPPNLTPLEYPRLLDAGINDWGGVSPVTPDHVNPEAAWPQIDELRARTAAAGKLLVERLPVYPRYALDSARWQHTRLVSAVTRAIDADGLARTDAWSPGLRLPPQAPQRYLPAHAVSPGVAEALAQARAGDELTERQIVALFGARDAEFQAVCAAADEIRRAAVGDIVRYVVNRNINYTNVCTFGCRFCAFSKSTRSSDLRGPAYDLSLEEVGRRAREAWDRGATEVCMQGGIHPDYTGNTYLGLLHAVREAAPQIHIHAFSPLEVCHGAQTLGLSVPRYLERLRDAGLNSLPGTAAEVLDDEVRAILCPDKLNTAQWLQVMRDAHSVGLRSTATIMFGHVDAPRHWARHLLAIRRLQAASAGFTEFVPLPFVHMEAPLYFKGRARKGPTFREAVLMHAIARLALHPLIPHVQVSWVKLGREGVTACLNAGADDLGGTLMNESISRSAGTEHGQELPPAEMEQWIQGAQRVACQRTTFYAPAAEERHAAALAARVLTPIVLTPPRRRGGAQLSPSATVSPSPIEAPLD